LLGYSFVLCFADPVGAISGNRAQWRQLAEDRVVDADVLLDRNRWSASYHLIGYAVERGLKACILAYVENGNADVIFRERRFSENCWTHTIEEKI
jgi:hypothetical protein